MSFIKINLTNLAHNYNYLKNIVGPKVTCAAAVKANAYGIGDQQVVETLSKQGCNDFFVAHIEEALNLRKFTKANIYCLHGVLNMQESELLVRNNIIPILNTAKQCQIYNDYAKTQEKKLPAILNFDTGMGRLGISPNAKIEIENIDIAYIMSHLACADESEHEQNHIQLSEFKKLKNIFPGHKFTLANSAGIFLGQDYHFDLVRPGAALYGIETNSKYPVLPVVSVYAKIMQIRTLEYDMHVGYGASALMPKGSVALIAEYGYADGYPRSLSNKAYCYYQGHYLKIMGKVSMDLIIIDATNLPEALLAEITHVELLGENIKLADLAAQVDTIGYEILTSLSKRAKKLFMPSLS